MSTESINHCLAISDRSLLKLAEHLSHIQAEKLAVQLKVDYGQVSALNRTYQDDPQMFAYRLLQKWWNACELDEAESLQELVVALKASDLASLVHFVSCDDSYTQGLPERQLMKLGANLDHYQTEQLALLLGIRRSSIESLKRLYFDDPQMFAFRTMLQWRDGCELSPEKQKEFLDSAIKSITSAVSNSRNDFSFHPYISHSASYNEDTEMDFPHYLTRRSLRGHCSCRRQTKIIVALYSLMLLSLGLCIVVLIAMACLPLMPDYSFWYHVGDTFLVPLSPDQSWIRSLELGLSDSETGKALALECSDLKPRFHWDYVTDYEFNYMTKGSKFYIEAEISDETWYLWLFTNYTVYHSALDSGYQGMDCTDPGTGNWCLEISHADNITLEYHVESDAYYFYGCYPDSYCSKLKNFKKYYGIYDFLNYTIDRSFVQLSSVSGKKLNLRNNFDFSKKELCVLVSVEWDSGRSSYQSIIKVTRLQHHTGYSIFPGIVGMLLVLPLLLHLMFLCSRSCRNRHCRHNLSIRSDGHELREFLHDMNDSDDV